MPTHNHPTNARPLPAGQACPFEWCTVDHVDDWLNDENGDAARAHFRDLPGGVEQQAPYFVVDETRTVFGVTFSPALVQITDSDRATVDEYAEQLSGALALLPSWRAAALAVDEIRADLAAGR